MQVTVQLTRAELVEMGANENQTKVGVIQTLDGGIEIDEGGKVYLACFNVDVQVVE